MAENNKDLLRASDEAAINDLYERWRTAWLNLDAKLMLSLFDPNCDGPVYQSEENPEALLDYSALEAYWANAVNILRKVPRWTELKKHVVLLGEDSAAIWVLLDTTLYLNVSPPQELSGKLRCVMGLRKTNSKWLIVHYHESRQFLMAPNAQGIWSYSIEHSKAVLGNQ